MEINNRLLKTNELKRKSKGKLDNIWSELKQEHNISNSWDAAKALFRRRFIAVKFLY